MPPKTLRRWKEVARGRIEDAKKVKEEEEEDNDEGIGQPEQIVGGTLKKYQLEGVRWLASRHKWFMPAILGDEMVIWG